MSGDNPCKARRLTHGPSFASSSSLMTLSDDGSSPPRSHSSSSSPSNRSNVSSPLHGEIDEDDEYNPPLTQDVVHDVFIPSPTLFRSPRTRKGLFTFPTRTEDIRAIQKSRVQVEAEASKEEEEEEEVVDQEEEEEEEELDVPDSQRFWCKEQPFVVALSLIASGCPRSYEIAHSSPLFEDVFRSIILNPSQFSLLIGARAVRTVSRICMEEASFTVLDNIVPSYPKAPVCYLDSSQTGMATMNRRGRPRAEIMGTDANGDPSINVNMDVDMDVDVDTDTDTEMVIHEAPIRPCSFSRFPRTFHRRSEWKRLYIARDLIQCHGQHGVFWGEEPENMAQRVFVWCTETLVTQKSRPEHWRLANELLNLIGRHFRQVDDEVAMKSHIYECTLESMRWIGNRVADLRILMGRLDGHPLKRRIKWLLAWKILHVLANIDRDPPFAILIVDHDGDDGSDGRVWEEARKLQSELVALLNVVSLNDGLSLTVFADAILCLSEMTIDSPHFELDEIERFRHLIKSQIKRLSPKKRTFANCRMESAIRRIGDCIQNARASSQDRCWYSSKGRELVV